MASSKPKSVFQAAARSKEFFDHLQAHYRECKRRKMDIDADVKIIKDDGTIFSHGSAKVRDVSPSGALLADMELDKDAFPLGSFAVEMRMRSSGYEGIGFRCKPVRFVTEERGIGVRFEEVFVEDKS